MLRNNQVVISCCVEGCRGPLIPKPDPNKSHHVWSNVVGTVIWVEGKHSWIVVFNYDKGAKVAKSIFLKVVPTDTGAPLNELSRGGGTEIYTTEVLASIVVLSPAVV